MSPDLEIYYAYVRQLPSYPEGRFIDVELAHIKGIPMKGVAGRMLKQLAPRRQGPSAYLVLPVAPEDHQETSPGSIHAIGEEAWLESYGLDRAHALGYILGNVITFHLGWLQAIAEDDYRKDTRE